MSLSRRFVRPAYVAFFIAAASTAGCSLVTDFGTPIPDDDASAADVGIDSSVDTSMDSGDATTDAADTSLDADTADATDTADSGTDASDGAVDDASDASDGAVDDASDAAAIDTAMCATGADCSGTDGDCATRTCTAGVCGTSFTADGTAVAAQTAGDCKKVVCDGAGGTKPVDDDTDLPNDSRHCTSDVCSGGVVSHPVVSAGAPCAETGGTVCDDAGTCVECNASSDCTGGKACDTTTHVCVAPSCSDAVKNGSETDVDCGGTCGPCAKGKICGGAGDCSTGVCSGGVCQAESCSDAVKNGTESDVDCGGGSCGPCATDKACRGAADCATGVCRNGLCRAASCVDAVKNGGETDVDCGGTCMKCAAGKACQLPLDCMSGSCSGGVCAPPN